MNTNQAPKILVVESAPVFQERYKSELPQNYHVIVASHVEAETAFSRNKSDLAGIVMNAGPLGKEELGTDLVHLFRSNNFAGKIIGCSVYPSAREELSAAGCDQVYSKSDFLANASQNLGRLAL